MRKDFIHRNRGKSLGLLELIAIALGGMIGGGIFTVLGISVSMIGIFTPVAIAVGGIIAALAAYSYIKLGVYYKDEGATYSFFKRTFPNSSFAASLIGWWVIFGYISTVALYAYTFSSYVLSSFTFADNEIIRKIVACGVIALFTVINLWSVKGMGKIEDIMVYTKLILLAIISFSLINHSQTTLPSLLNEHEANSSIINILIVASLTFVAYEGFQLIVNAVNEMSNPKKNIPKAIYSAIFLAVLIYVIIAIGAILAIPFESIIANKEYALASGAEKTLGHFGSELVIVGAILATSSAINGTLFGASRQMSVIAQDGFFPTLLSQRKNNIPLYSIIVMALLAMLLILIGNLRVILEFGSVTFLLVSLLMAYANFKIRHKTKSSVFLTLFAIITLFTGMVLILYYEIMTQIEQLYFIVGLYSFLSLSAYVYAKLHVKSMPKH